MNEQYADLGDVTLCYETFGDPANPPLLLIMGLSTQMVGWHEDFCLQLADGGFHVVRFDNRDIGRSTKIDGKPPNMWQLLRRDKSAAVYGLPDMADDTAALIDHLGFGSAHIVGASMGGMIAQTLAARHPDKVRSLTSIMSTTGNRWVGQPTAKVMTLFLRRPPSDREGYVAGAVTAFGLFGGKGFGDISDEVRDRSSKAFDRGINPAGSGRQLAAIIASGNRTAEVARITAPTLVIHGDEDTLVRLSGGRATAKAIKGAKLAVVKGMGHFLPRKAWPHIVPRILDHAGAAEATRAKATA